MKTITEQLDNPYAAPQAELHPLPASRQFTRQPLGLRMNLLFGGLKFGSICGCLFCLFLAVLFVADAIRISNSERIFNQLGLLIIYSVYVLSFLSILGLCAGIVLMALDFVLQMIGLSDPPEQKTPR